MCLKSLLINLILFSTSQCELQVNLFSRPDCQGVANRIQIPREDTNPNPFQCTAIRGDRHNFYTRSAQVNSISGDSCNHVTLLTLEHCQMSSTHYNVTCGGCGNVELTVASVLTPHRSSRRRAIAPTTTVRSFVSNRPTFGQILFPEAEEDKAIAQVNLFSERNCGGTANRILIAQDFYNPNNFQCTEVKGDRANFRARSVQIGFHRVGCQTVTLSNSACHSATGSRILCGQGCVNVDLVVGTILLTKNDNSVTTRPPRPRPSAEPKRLTDQYQRSAQRQGARNPSEFEVSLFSQPNCGGEANRIAIRNNKQNPNNFQCTEVAGQRANFYSRSVLTNNCQGVSINLISLTQCQQQSSGFPVVCGTCSNVDLRVGSILIEKGARNRKPPAQDGRVTQPVSRRTTPFPVQNQNQNLRPNSPPQRQNTQASRPPSSGPDNDYDDSNRPGLHPGGGRLIQHKFHISYTSLSPDGVTLPVLSINKHFPGPILYAELGDTMEVEVFNEIQGGQNVTIHWHGIHQRGTPFQDGPSMITQCPIKKGSSQKYVFPLHQSGTYWYHSHVGSQYTEGLWGALVIRNKEEVYNYDGELTITLNDWYHTSAKENEAWFLSSRSGGFPPYPNSALMNGLGQYACEHSTTKPCGKKKQRRPLYKLNPGRVYRLRLINTSAWSAFNFAIDDHKLLPIEVDGVDVAPSQKFYGMDDADSVFIGPGQRYSFLLKKVGTGNYKEHVMRGILREDLIGSPPHNINENIGALNPLVTGLLVYTNEEQTAPIVPMEMQHFDYTSYVARPTLRDYNQINDSHLVPHDRKKAPRKTDREFVVTVVRTVDRNNVHHIAFNNNTFSLPHDQPLLMSVMNNVQLPQSASPLYIDHKNVVQLVVNNPSFGVHPMHLHGHTFWVLGAGEPGDGDYSPRRHKLNHGALRRDTVMVQAFSWLVIKFMADNPGVWAFHCHIDWHNLAGMALTFVEAGDMARAQLRIPEESRRVCRQHGIRI